MEVIVILYLIGGLVVLLIILSAVDYIITRLKQRYMEKILKKYLGTFNDPSNLYAFYDGKIEGVEDWKEYSRWVAKQVEKGL